MSTHRDIAAAPILAQHIGHWVRVIDQRTLKCHPCMLTIVLPPAPLGPRTPTISPNAAPRDPQPHETCPSHPGEFRHTCRCCAADARAAHAADQGQPAPISHIRTGADPTQVPEWQAAREELAARIAARKQREALDAAQEATQAAEQQPPTDPEPSPPTDTLDHDTQAGGSTL